MKSHNVKSLKAWCVLLAVIVLSVPLLVPLFPKVVSLDRSCGRSFSLFQPFFFTGEALQAVCSSCSFCRFSFTSAINLESCFGLK